VTGVAAVWEIAFGGTPRPGLVIGAGAFNANSPSPTASLSGTSATVPAGAVGLGVIAPFIDYYPTPDKGFHLQAAIGIAVLSAAKGQRQSSCSTMTTATGTGTITTETCTDGAVAPDDYLGFGFGGMAGIGYEGWVGPQSSLGVLARVTAGTGTISAQNDTSLPDARVTAVVPGVLLSYTYH
jgi:hypothetical protein